MSGAVYCVTNAANGKQYVGQTTLTLVNRWKLHLKSALDCFSMGALHCAIRKYGVEAFAVEQIDAAESQDELNEKEIHHVARLGTYGGGYNLTPGGRQTEFSEETRQKMSRAATQRIASEKTRQKMSESARNISEETRQKMSIASTGRFPSSEVRRKISLAKIKTHCKRGHPFDETNTYHHFGSRRCLTCAYLLSTGKVPKKLEAYVK